MKKLLGILAVLVLIFSCTENSRVKHYGGTGNIDLSAGEKLINVTWKGQELWILTRPMLSTDSAVTYKFHEKSSYGIVEGTYIITEKKK